MDGIVTRLSPAQDEIVGRIWHDLEESCGLRVIEESPIPHFSWIVAESFDLPEAGRILTELAAEARPFSVLTVGLGIFLDPEPVIYTPVIKNRELLDLHARVWQAVYPVGIGVSEYYAPGVWMPHITLAHRDLTEGSVGCAIERLIGLDLNWEVSVDNLAIIRQRDDQVGALRSTYRFAG
jgi:2'-5' RNA ligase